MDSKHYVIAFFVLFLVGFVLSADSLESFSGNFTEGFESGTFTTNNWSSSGGATANWVVSTANPRTGTYHAQATNTDAESVLSTGLNTSGYGNITFSFWYRTVGLDAGEYLRVDWYNGSVWTNLLDVTATAVNTYTLASYSLGASSEDNSDFAIRFRCSVDNPNENCGVDDIQILGEEILGIDFVDLYLLSQEGVRIDTYNNTAAEESDVMVMNFSVNHLDSIDTWYLNYTANGTNGCALGNKQSSYCYSYPEWIQFINGTETDTFDALKKSDFDYIETFLSEGDLSNFSFIIDEHYNPNVFKWYDVDFNFSDEKWLNDSQYRIGSETMIKIEINNSIVPVDMDFARIDLKISYAGAPEKLEMFACNSSLTDQDPHFYSGCNLIGETAYYELYENGTKFKAFFNKNLLDQIGDFKYVVLHSEGENPGEYYYISTYGFNDANYSNHWEYSNDLGSTWNKSSLMYDTQMNINWFYANSDENKTAFVYRFFVNTTSGYEEYYEGNLTWNIAPVNNYPPLVVLSSPDPLDYISLPYNVTFSVSDTNDDNLSVVLALYQNDTLNTTLLNETNGALENYYWNQSVADSEYELVLEVCEVNTTDLYCRNNTRVITVDNTTPVFNSVYPLAGTNFNNIFSLNISANVSESNVDFVYVNVTYPNSSIVRFNMTNYSLEEYNVTLEISEIGNYSLDFFVEDLAGNTETQSSNFTVSDVRAPSVHVLYPRGGNFSSRDEVDLVLNITDFTALDEIYANITYPNSTLKRESGFSFCLESDDFENNTVGSYWENITESISSGQSCQMTINETYEGKMYLSISGTGSSGTTYCGFNSEEKVYGDFDMNIDFNATTLEEDSIFVFRSSNIETFLPDGIRVFLILFRSGGNIVYSVGYSEDGVVNETTINVNDTSGSFGIKKSNSTGVPIFNLFYLNGSSWVDVFGNISLEGSRETQYVQIYSVSSAPSYGNINVLLDEFNISGHDNYIANSGFYSLGGVYNVSFFANDTEGNVNATEETNFSVVVLNHAPSRPFISNPNIGEYHSGVIEIDWLDVSDSENDTLQYNISLLNSDDSFNSTIVSYYGDIDSVSYDWNSSTVSDGEYKIEIVVFENDTFENYTSTDVMSGTFFVDNTNPEIEFLQGTTLEGSYESGGIDFNVNFSDANLDNVTVFLYSGSTLVDLSSSSASTYSGSFTGLSSGTYQLYATVYDLAGNENSTEVREIVIDLAESDGSSGGGGSAYSLIDIHRDRNDEYTGLFFEGKKTKFNLDDVEHELEVVDINLIDVYLRFYSDVFERNLTVSESWYLNLDNDSRFDCLVVINSIRPRYANLTIKSLDLDPYLDTSAVDSGGGFDYFEEEIEIGRGITGNVVGDFFKDSGYLVLVIVGILFIIYFVFRFVRARMYRERIFLRPGERIDYNNVRSSFWRKVLNVRDRIFGHGFERI